MKIGQYKNKILLIFAFVILCVIAVCFSIKCNKVGTIVSAIGSIASLYAIIEAIVRVKSIEKQNKEIKQAVEQKIYAINKQETTEQINKYIEVIARIQAFINLRNADAALLKVEELQLFLHNIHNNPTTDEEIRAEITKHIRIVKHDSIILRTREINEPFPKDADCKTLNRNLENLHSTLMKYSQQIHFEK